MPPTTISTMSKQLFAPILFHLTTIYLFCKSDIITTLIPVSGLAFAATPICSTETTWRAAQAVFWLFLHLWQFNLSNQLYSVEEDRQNHPYRPLAAGRISFSTAFILRWASTLACLALSSLYDSPLLIVTSFMSGLFAYLYNETILHKFWIFRASFNALGYGAFKLGTMLVCSCDRTRLDPVAYDALLIAMGIIWTTVYVQDFQDVEGDAMTDRSTLPLVYPKLSRAAVLPSLFGWSLFLAYMWDMDVSHGAVLVTFGTWVAMRFILLGGVEVDKISYTWYNAWLGLSCLLPGYYRLRGSQ